MNVFGRAGRHADRWTSPHERARSRAAERLDSLLDTDESAWLDAHLSECVACRAVAEAYESDRQALRTLRDVTPEPPRDLWARTAAGIEREAAGRRAGRPAPSMRRFPLGPMAGVAVVAVVVGASLLSGRWFDGPRALATPDVGSPGPASAAVGPSFSPGATPIAVDAGPVAWVHTDENGTFAFNEANIDEVCPLDDQPGCAALDDREARHIAIKNTPKSVIGSPDDKQAIVVTPDDKVIVLAIPNRASQSTAPTATPVDTATVSPTATAPTSAPSSSAPSSAAPTDTASPTDTAAPTDSAEPSGSAEPTPSTEPSPTPTLTPEPTVALELAIATGVQVVGESAAYSDDGQWFAFSARPSDGSGGPDIYAWRVGDALATRITNDGVSIFASWAGDRIVGSRPVGDDLGGGQRQVTSFLIDPATGTVEELGVPIWRPAVDPTGRYALAWDGTVVVDATGTDIRPSEGGLRLLTWPVDPTAVEAHGTPLDEHATIDDFDVRWDETGAWVAVWIAEPADPTIGHLTLLRLDAATGELTVPHGAPHDTPALAGFSIGAGRLAWVTPEGQDAQGSRVQVIAWSGPDVGAVESVPGEDVIIVR